MADVSKCMGYGCGKKEQCFRYTCIPNPFQQSYGQFGVSMDGKECFGFIPHESTGKLKQLKK